jgi:hypothetical protein
VVLALAVGPTLIGSVAYATVTQPRNEMQNDSNAEDIGAGQTSTNSGYAGFEGSGVEDGGTNGGFSTGGQTTAVAASTGYITPWSENASGHPPTNCIDVHNGNAIGGAPIWIHPCNGDSNQSWELLPTENGGYLVGFAGTCISIGDDNALVIEEGCAGATNWDWLRDGTIRSSSGLCMTWTGYGNTAMSAATCVTGDSNQLWMIHGTGEISVTGGTPGEPPYCLEIPNFSSTTGTDVDLNYCNGGENQRWVYTQAGLIVGEWGLCLKYEGNGNNLHAVTCAGGVDLLWASNLSYGLVGSIWSQDYTNEFLVADASLDDFYYPGMGVIAVTNPSEYITNGWEHMIRQPVALIPQESSNWCWLAVAQMTMGYYGISGIEGPAQCVLANIVTSGRGQGEPCCTTDSPNTVDGGFNNTTVCNVTGGVATILTHYGFTYDTDTSPSFDTISTQIGGDFVLPAGVTGPDYNHYVLVIGADVGADGNEWIIYNDPWADDQTTGLGEQVAMPWDIFGNQNPDAYSGDTLNFVLTDVGY